jgi:hypothetical protein
MASTAARRERRAERAARKRFSKAFKRQTAGCATAPIAAGEKERVAIDRMIGYLAPKEAELRGLLQETGLTDGVIYVAVPDADDRAALLALPAATGADPEATARAVSMALAKYIITPHDRCALLASLEATPAWGPEALAALRRPPPTGSLMVVFDGTETGHGVLTAAPVARGGSA